MKKLGAYELGRKTEKKFLVGIIPDNWLETVYEADPHWSVEVKGEYLSDVNWKLLVTKINFEFKGTKVEINSIEQNGIHFIVYLFKKTQ